MSRLERWAHLRGSNGSVARMDGRGGSFREGRYGGVGGGVVRNFVHNNFTLPLQHSNIN